MQKTHFSNLIYPDAADPVGHLDARNYIARGTIWRPEGAPGVTPYDQVEAEDLSALDVQEIGIEGEIFVYDPDDTTTPHNPGAGVLKTSDDKVFKSDIVAGMFVNVLAIVDEPPASPPPAPNDRYFTSAAPTGDFENNPNEFAVYLSSGWRFVPPAIGQRFYNRETKSYFHWSEDGVLVDDELQAEDSVDLIDLRYPFSPVAESETDRPPSSQIGSGTGAAIGDMTENGGLGAAFNDVDVVGAASCAAKSSASDAYVGKHYNVAPQRVSYVEVFPASDQGFLGGASGNITLELRARNGTAPATGQDGTVLGTAGPFPDQTDPVLVGTALEFAKDEWDFIWVRVLSTASGTLYVAELKIHTPALVPEGTLYIVAANAIGAFLNQDTKIADADGGGGWRRFHLPYQEAQIGDKLRSVPRVFRDGEWLVSGGASQTFKFYTNDSNGNSAVVPLTSFYGVYQSTVAPTVNQRRWQDNNVLSITTREKTALRFNVSFDITFENTITGTNYGDHGVAVAIFRDAETNAVLWSSFNMEHENDFVLWNQPPLWRYETELVLRVTDAAPRTFRLAVMSGFDASTLRFIDAFVTKRRFSLEEMVVTS